MGTFQILISACQLLCKSSKSINRTTKETALCSKLDWFALEVLKVNQGIIIGILFVVQ